MQTSEQFVELEKIGKGAFSVVYKCKHTLDGKEYALKKLRLNTNKSYSLNFENNTKLFEEIKHLSKLQHPNIVRYYGCWVKESDEGNSRSLDEDQAIIQPRANNHRARNRLQSDHSSETSSSSFEENCDLDAPKHKQHQDGYQEDGTNSDSYKIEEESFSPTHPSPSKSIDYASPPSSQRRKTAKKDFKNNQSDQKVLKIKRILDFPALIDEVNFTPEGSPHKQVKSSENTPELKQKQPHYECYIQTELCQMTLREYLDDRNKQIRLQPNDLSWVSVAFQLAKGLVQGLMYMSSQGIVHRDIKPANIFLDTNLVPKYGDFGLVKDCAEDPSDMLFQTPMLSPHTSGQRKDSAPTWYCRQDSTVDVSDSHSSTLQCVRTRRYSCIVDDKDYFLTRKVGTLMYASPEQINSNRYTKKTDYFSLGLVLVEVFLPLYTEMERYKLFEAIRSKERVEREILPGYGFHLSRLLEQLLKKDSSKRIPLDLLFQSIHAMEVAFLKTMHHTNSWEVSVLPEGESDWKERVLTVVPGKAYLSIPNKIKAECQLDLNEYRVFSVTDSTSAIDDMDRRSSETDLGRADALSSNSPKAASSNRGSLKTNLIEFRSEILPNICLKVHGDNPEVQAEALLAAVENNHNILSVY